MMELIFPSVDIVSLFPCMLRCMLSSMLLACLPLSRLSLNGVSLNEADLNLVQKSAIPNGVFNESLLKEKASKTRHKNVGPRRDYSQRDDSKDIDLVSQASFRRWSARRRDPRVNGADLYVVRITKHGGVGCAKPCWRCIEWCRWAGVKRIFHCDGQWGKFQVVKVNESCSVYETQADIRLFNGMVRGLLVPSNQRSFSVFFSLTRCIIDQ